MLRIIFQKLVNQPTSSPSSTTPKEEKGSSSGERRDSKEKGNRILSRVIDFDFIGDSVCPLNSEFEIQFGSRLKTNASEDRVFRLFKSGHVVKTGKLPREINCADILADGRFFLSLRTNSQGSDVWVFDSNGDQVTSVPIPYYASFIRIQEPNNLLFSSQNMIVSLSLDPLWEDFRFNIPNSFIPTDGWISDGIVKLVDRDDFTYQFGKDGSFPEYSTWFGRYLQSASAQNIFSVIQDEFKRHARGDQSWTEDDFRSAAGWLDLALEKEEKDSFRYKKSDVLNLKASLLRKAGDEDSAETAQQEADQNKDGFRVVDETEALLKKSNRNEESLQIALKDLDRAKSYPRLAEYPNYYGRLFRFEGEILAMFGDVAGAVEAFETALKINPKVGCKRQLESLKKRA